MAILGLLLGNPGTKSHSNMGVARRHSEYYMGEGGGFLRVQAMLSLVSLELPVACRSTKSVLEISAGSSK